MHVCGGAGGGGGGGSSEGVIIRKRPLLSPTPSNIHFSTL